jgi:hypothetical protein
VSEIATPGWEAPRTGTSPAGGAVRALLLAGWLCTAAGCYGPWIAHPTAALTLSGVDLAEFVKFLPEVLDGSLTLIRESFYLPVLAVAGGIALLGGSRRTGFPAWARALLLIFVAPVSLQLLPPAWSPASLLSAEFGAQTVSLALVWLVLAAFWTWRRAPAVPAALAAGALAAAAGVLAPWQILGAKPAIDAVYGRAPVIGWGLYLSEAGLGLLLLASLILAVTARRQARPGRWAKQP